MGECARVHERLPQSSPYRFPPTCWHFHNCSQSYFESAQDWNCGILLVCLLFQKSSAWHKGSFFESSLYLKASKQWGRHQTSAASSLSFGADLEDGLCSGRLHHTNDSKAVPKLTRVVLGESASSSDRHRDSLPPLLLEHTSLARPPGPLRHLAPPEQARREACFQYGEPNPIRGEPLEC